MLTPNFPDANQYLQIFLHEIRYLEKRFELKMQFFNKCRLLIFV
ncbi:hypothetical protein FDUTEX481_06794 [Tolypothrix sp. PCC 7601]|nr:hypothetical protein FDUTEX481_06794 [Tolypothrix sp. PCC 7601]